jgi:hypothetical protein
MKKTNDEVKPVMSREMLQKCKDKIRKFGFDGEQYIKFLISVAAMRNKKIVTKYRNDEMESYRDKFIRDCEVTLNDSFMFDKLSKIWTSDEHGGKHETGYFCPRNFWDNVLKEKYVVPQEYKMSEEEHERIRGLLKKYKPAYFDENTISYGATL